MQTGHICMHDTIIKKSKKLNKLWSSYTIQAAGHLLDLNVNLNFHLLCWTARLAKLHKVPIF